MLREIISAFAFIVTLLASPCFSSACSLFSLNSAEDKITLSENRLAAPDGTPFDLAKSVAERKLTVVCFLGTECPMVKLYLGRLRELSERFGSDVQVIGIASNRQDSAEELVKFCLEQHVQFPVLKDEGNVVADDFRATRTPEVVLVDSNLDVVYRGCIDDQYSPGVTRPKASNEFLLNAIEQSIEAKPIDSPSTEATGCVIGRVIKSTESTPAVTFSDQVSKVLNKHCVECHRPNEIGPFSLLDYDEVSGWGETMVEVIDNGRMPPWHASEGHALLQNTRHMPEADKQLIRDWVAAGMPEGNKSEIQEVTPFTTGWRLPREPDVVIEMSPTPFQVPADGVVEYQYFVVDPEFRQDVWIATAEIVPGNRRVVHHSIVFIKPPVDRGTWGIGWLGAYVPGQSAPKILPGHATFVPAGSKLVFQQHYTPTGRPETDVSKIGIVFAKAEEVTHHVYTLASLEQEFEIAPGNAAYSVHTRLDRLSPQASLLAVSPHMHYRGKSYHLSLTRNDESSQSLVDVPNYDFNWQHSYQFVNPIPLRDVKHFSSEFVFDNSTANLFNPDPNEYVTWGDQTWEEMAVSFLTFAEPIDAVREKNSQVEAEFQAKRGRLREQAFQFANSKSEEMFKCLDFNGDGLISRSEAPKSLTHFSFNWYDSNKDGAISKEECVETVLNNWTAK